MDEMPKRIAALPRDKHDRPVPWFAAWLHGVPDFRVVGLGRISHAVRLQICWICGTQLSGDRVFVVGPMCVVNRVSPEPPSHADCAEYAAKACPFLVFPHMRRRESSLDEIEGLTDPAGIMIRRNPGVTALYVTHGVRGYQIERHDDGLLFGLNNPARVEWFAEGRTATRTEALAAIDSGMPILRESAETDGPDAITALAEEYQAAQQWLPPATDSDPE